MSRVKTRAGRNAYRWDYQELRYLVYALTKTKNFQESLNLFLDLHTQKEISEIIRRLIIASDLIERKTFRQIKFHTGASANTVVKIAQKLQRQKTILPTILMRTGTPTDFEEFTAKASDPLNKKLDRLLEQSTLGLLHFTKKIR